MYSGRPADHDGALTVLREVVSSGITHIDTSDFYGPHVTNQLIKEALHPYPQQLRIVDQGRGAAGRGRKLAQSARSEMNFDKPFMIILRTLVLVTRCRQSAGRWPGAPEPGSIAQPFSVLAEMQQKGPIKHLGVSNVNAEQVARGPNQSHR